MVGPPDEPRPSPAACAQRRAVGPAARAARRRRRSAGRFPTLAPGRRRGRAVRGARPGFVRPEATVAAHLRSPRRAGADLRFGEPVLRLGRRPRRRRAGAHRRGQLQRRPARRLPRARGRRSCSPTSACRSRRAPGAVLVRARRRRRAVPPDRHPIYIWEDAGGRAVLRLPGDRRPGRGGEGRVLPRRPRRAPRTRSTATVHRRRGRRDGATSVGAVLPDAAGPVPAARRPACTPPRPTSTSSSRTHPRARRRRPWPADSPGTASSSCPSSARSSPTSRRPGRPAHPIAPVRPAPDRLAGQHLVHGGADVTTRPPGPSPEPRPAPPPDSLVRRCPVTPTPIPASSPPSRSRSSNACGSARSRAADLADAGRVPHGAGRPRERARHRAAATARLRAFLNVCRHRGARLCTERRRRRSSARSSARTTPGPTASTASWSPRRT